MSFNEQRLLLSTNWSAQDQTVGKFGFIAVIARGSAAASQISLLDGTALKYIVEVAATSLAGFVLPKAQAFNNLIVDITGTGSYSVVYQPLT